MIIVIHDYIPAREGVYNDEGSKRCGLDYKKNKNLRYADGEYFYKFDECTIEEPIVRYQIEYPPKAASYQVIATTSDLKLIDIEYKVKDEKRPAAKAELSTESARKNRNPAGDCFTEPASIRDARIMLTAKVEKSSQSLRLSTYEDPGCYGHLGRFYILDVLEHGKVIETYTLSRYEGAM